MNNLFEILIFVYPALEFVRKYKLTLGLHLKMHANEQ